MILGLFIFLIVFGFAWILQDEHNKTPQKKAPGYYEQHPETKGNFVFHCKQLNSLESFMNFGKETSGLKTFEYHNRYLTITMNDGTHFQGMIEDMTARFTFYKGGNYGCELSCGSSKVYIFTYWHLFTDEEWWTIFNIFTHCGTTYCVEYYLDTRELYMTKDGKVARGLVAAAKIITRL